jgi:hypothetical protein
VLLLPPDNVLHSFEIDFPLFGYPLSLPGNFEAFLTFDIEDAVDCSANEAMTGGILTHNVLQQVHCAVFVRFFEILGDGGR